MRRRLLPVARPFGSLGGGAGAASSTSAMTLHGRLHRLEGGLLILGLLLLSAWCTTSVESRHFQSMESQRLDLALRAARDTAVVAARSPLVVSMTPGTPSPQPPSASARVLGRIEIPRLRIAAIVAEGTDAGTLGRAVGHIPFSATPGSPGNCALAGHRDTFFRRLGGVRVNDLIRIVTLEGTYVYRVDWRAVVVPQRVDVLDSTTARSLTLVTCYPFVFVGHAPQRFVVRARQLTAVAELAPATERRAFPLAGLPAEGR